MIKISVIGLGYVGLPLAMALQKTSMVVGYDKSESRVLELSKNYDKNNEFSKNILASCKNLTYTNDTNNLNNSDIFIVTVPTPIYKNNTPDLRHLADVCNLIGKKINNGNIVVFESTVYPGCTENFCGKIIEKISNKKINKDFFLAYSPERINVGDKKYKLENIKKIVGASDLKTLNKVSTLYARIIKAGIYKCENIIIAEAAKAIENAQRDINIAFINEIGIIFNKLDINLHAVLRAASTKWNFLNFKPGLVGGHCIGVDPYYLTYIAKKIGVKPKIIDAGRNTNDLMYRNLGSDFLKKALLKKKKNNILVLGIAFKENTNDLRNSKIYDLCRYLSNKHQDVIVYDPLIEYNIEDKYFKFTNKINFQLKFDGVFFAVPHKKILSQLNKLVYFVKENSLIYDLKDAIPKNIKFKKNLKIVKF